MTQKPQSRRSAEFADLLARTRLVVFDVDGTLYRHDIVRVQMARMLATHLLWSARGRRKIGIVKRFREVREQLADREERGVVRKQYALVADMLGVSAAEVQDVTTEWLEKRPLPLLHSAAQPAIRELFSSLERAGIPVAVFSDYPAREKLAALGLSAGIVVSATEPAVDCFKPLPDGLNRVIEIAGEHPEQVLMIGDRDERDGECARRAGTRYLIKVSSRAHAPEHLAHYGDLLDALERS
jgi:FMN phosphatase YigB (HAD superfamily)